MAGYRDKFLTNDPTSGQNSNPPGYNGHEMMARPMVGGTDLADRKSDVAFRFVVDKDGRLYVRGYNKDPKDDTHKTVIWGYVEAADAAALAKHIMTAQTTIGKTKAPLT